MNLPRALVSLSRNGNTLIADARGGIEDVEEIALFSYERRVR